MATQNSGAFLFSEDGTTQIYNFTKENSPLLSNTIIDIAVNGKTGDVFFATDKGLISFRGYATDGASDFGKVYAYPNPVRQGFTGIITITGLMDNTQVKITDINGHLVCETVSNGSLATWDGKDIHGRKVSTGIYLAMCINPDGTNSTITKILVIN